MPEEPAGQPVDPAREEIPSNRRQTLIAPMTALNNQNGALHAEALPLSAIADHMRTPVFVYSAALLEQAGRNGTTP